MRKRLLVVIMAAIAGLVATAAPSNAAVVLNDIRVPVSDTLFVPCANGGVGENVNITAESHILVSATLNGNNVSVGLHWNFDGTGAGADTGATYQFSNVANLRESGNLQNGRFTASLSQDIKVTGQGSAPNFTLSVVSHIQVNADGTTTVLFETVKAVCA
jgi:hypothetical protein